MKLLFKSLIIIAAFASFQFLQSCGGLKIEEGDLSFLAGQTKLNLEFDYSDMGVGKFATEKEYVEKKTDDYNKDEAGRGDDWAKRWVRDRKESFQPKFEDLLNKYVREKGLSINPDNSGAKYTMIVKTTFTEPGWNIYISKKPARIDLDIIFVETKNKKNVLCKIRMENIPGSQYGGHDFDSGTRISEAYAKAGKDLGKYLMKQDF